MTEKRYGKKKSVLQPPIDPLSSRYIHWYITLMRLFLLLVALCAALAARPALSGGLTVFAAASTIVPLREIEKSWNAARNGRLRIVYGSSGGLARQIAAGAPADVYISAHVRWIEYLIDRKHVRADGRAAFAGNRLVLIAPVSSSLRTIASTATIPDLLGTGDRLAIGDPRHVPAGIYARQILENLGLWERIAPRAVRSPNVRVALALVERGEAALGIVYRSDAQATGAVRVLTKFSQKLHDPVRYEAVATRGAAAGTAAFIAYLGSDAAQRLFRDAGFAAP